MTCPRTQRPVCHTTIQRESVLPNSSPARPTPEYYGLDKTRSQMTSELVSLSGFQSVGQRILKSASQSIRQSVLVTRCTASHLVFNFPRVGIYMELLQTITTTTTMILTTTSTTKQQLVMLLTMTMVMAVTMM